MHGNKTPQLSYAGDVEGVARKALVNSIELMSGRRKLEQLYRAALDRLDRQPEVTFWEAALDVLQVNLDYNPARLAAIPRRGPLIFIANHPFGVLDGLAVCHLAAKARGDFRILLHRALCREERIAQHMLPIDFTDSPESVRLNIATKRKSLDFLRAGGAMVIFPAGGISTATKLFGGVTDLEWKLFTAKLIQLTEATVVPIYVHGQNGRLFQLVSHFSLTLRLSLIIREVKKRQAATIRASIGEPIPYEQMAELKSRRELMNHLRRVTYALGGMPDIRPASIGGMSDAPLWTIHHQSALATPLPTTGDD
jgi:putative hemolysin